MLTVVHLRQSRSERILWLCEELGVDYAIEVHDRTPAFRAPEAMRTVHPLGKSPLLRDGELVLAESGAIVDYLVTRYGRGRLAPGHDDPAWPRYVFWLHFCEGSLMALGVTEMLLCSGMVPGVEAGPLGPQLGAELRRTLAWVDEDMAGRDFAAGDDFSAADVMLAYTLDFAAGRGLLEGTRHLPAYLERMRARPAWARARAKAA